MLDCKGMTTFVQCMTLFRRETRATGSSLMFLFMLLERGPLTVFFHWRCWVNDLEKSKECALLGAHPRTIGLPCLAIGRSATNLPMKIMMSLDASGNHLRFYHAASKT